MEDQLDITPFLEGTETNDDLIPLSTCHTLIMDEYLYNGVTITHEDFVLPTKYGGPVPIIHGEYEHPTTMAVRNLLQEYPYQQTSGLVRTWMVPSGVLVYFEYRVYHTEQGHPVGQKSYKVTTVNIGVYLNVNDPTVLEGLSPPHTDDSDDGDSTTESAGDEGDAGTDDSASGSNASGSSESEPSVFSGTDYSSSGEFDSSIHFLKKVEPSDDPLSVLFQGGPRVTGQVSWDGNSYVYQDIDPIAEAVATYVTIREKVARDPWDALTHTVNKWEPPVNDKVEKMVQQAPWKVKDTRLSS